MCFQFKPPDPLPERTPPPLSDVDRLFDDVLAYAEAWVSVHFYGLTLHEAREKVRLETAKLNAYHAAMEDGI